MILLNGRPIGFGSYPNGETLIDAASFFGLTYNLTLKYESDEDLVRLIFIKRHLEDNPVHLTIRYMPYSRMDRSESGSVFTLRYVTDLINWLDFRTVTVEEPHSDVTCALLNRCIVRYPTIDLLPWVIKDIGWHKSYDHLFYPDAGAQKRYAKITGYKTAVGFKHRDFATGKLSGELDAVGFQPAASPTKVLILDDLCSYGGTFVMAVKKLRELGAHEVYLFVAHCENSMWRGDVLRHVDGLYCTDSILNEPLQDDSEPGAWQQHPFRNKVHIYSEGKWQ